MAWIWVPLIALAKVIRALAPARFAVTRIKRALSCRTSIS